MTSKALRIAHQSLDKKRIEKLIQELRVIVVGGQAKVILDVAHKLLQDVFDGDLAAALQRRGNKENSLRQLALRAEEFGMSASGVMRCIPIYAQAREIGRALAEKLEVSQHVALLPLRSLEHKRTLAEQAAEQRWPVKRLREEVRRKQDAHAGGRTPDPLLQRLVETLHRPFQEVELDELDRNLGRIDDGLAKDLLGKVNQVRSHLDRIEKLLVRLNIQRARAAD
jgi:hypothetical protein